MTDADSNEEWLAMRAVWREDWDSVATYVNEVDLDTRLSQIMSEGTGSLLHRCLLVLGVHSAYGFKFEDMEFVESIWQNSMVFLRRQAPDMLGEVKWYWNETVYRFYHGTGICVDCKDFGFD